MAWIISDGMRYFTRPQSDWPEDEYPMLEGKVVHEAEPINTGLTDKNGKPIYRCRYPIGFVNLGYRA